MLVLVECLKLAIPTPMDTPEVDFIKSELKLAHTLLRLADTEMAVPADPDGAACAINYARTALEVARRFLPGVNMVETDRAAIEHALANLEADLQTRQTRETASP